MPETSGTKLGSDARVGGAGSAPSRNNTGAGPRAGTNNTVSPTNGSRNNSGAGPSMGGGNIGGQRSSNNPTGGALNAPARTAPSTGNPNLGAGRSSTPASPMGGQGASFSNPRAATNFNNRVSANTWVGNNPSGSFPSAQQTYNDTAARLAAQTSFNRPQQVADPRAGMVPNNAGQLRALTKSEGPLGSGWQDRVPQESYNPLSSVRTPAPAPASYNPLSSVRAPAAVDNSYLGVNPQMSFGENWGNNTITGNLTRSVAEAALGNNTPTQPYSARSPEPVRLAPGYTGGLGVVATNGDFTQATGMNTPTAQRDAAYGFSNTVTPSNEQSQYTGPRRMSMPSLGDRQAAMEGYQREKQAAAGAIDRGAALATPVSLTEAANDGVVSRFTTGKLLGQDNPDQFNNSIRNPNIQSYINKPKEQQGGLLNENHVPMVEWKGNFSPDLSPQGKKLYQAIEDTALRTQQPVTAFSGRRNSGSPNHDTGNAVDVYLRDGNTGMPVGYDKIGSDAYNPVGSVNPRYGRTPYVAAKIQNALEGPYRDWASDVFDTVYQNPDAYTGVKDAIRYGGTFKQGVPKDYMHLDVTPGASMGTQGPMRNAAAARALAGDYFVNSGMLGGDGYASMTDTALSGGSLPSLSRAPYDNTGIEAASAEGDYPGGDGISPADIGGGFNTSTTPDEPAFSTDPKQAVGDLGDPMYPPKGKIETALGYVPYAGPMLKAARWLGEREWENMTADERLALVDKWNQNRDTYGRTDLGDGRSSELTNSLFGSGEQPRTNPVILPPTAPATDVPPPPTAVSPLAREYLGPVDPYNYGFGAERDYYDYG